MTGAVHRRTPVGGVSEGRVHDPFGLLILLVFHPSVLKPDLYLALGEIKEVGHLDAPRAAQVPVKVELLLQFHQLGAGVSSPDPFRGGPGRALLVAHLTWKETVRSEKSSITLIHFHIGRK